MQTNNLNKSNRRKGWEQALLDVPPTIRRYRQERSSQWIEGNLDRNRRLKDRLYSNSRERSLSRTPRNNVPEENQIYLRNLLRRNLRNGINPHF